MTPDTLKYLEEMLIKRVLELVETLYPITSVGIIGIGPTVAAEELITAKTALKEVRRSIRRAENRAARKQERS